MVAIFGSVDMPKCTEIVPPDQSNGTTPRAKLSIDKKFVVSVIKYIITLIILTFFIFKNVKMT